MSSYYSVDAPPITRICKILQLNTCLVPTASVGVPYSTGRCHFSATKLPSLLAVTLIIQEVIHAAGWETKTKASLSRLRKLRHLLCGDA